MGEFEDKIIFIISKVEKNVTAKSIHRCDSWADCRLNFEQSSPPRIALGDTTH